MRDWLRISTAWFEESDRFRNTSTYSSTSFQLSALILFLTKCILCLLVTEIFVKTNGFPVVDHLAARWLEAGFPLC
jgi:hypothetical protein